MSRSWAGGSTRAHRRARKDVLDRDGHRCQLHIDGNTTCPRHNRICPPICTGVATHAHHTHGKEATGDDPRFMAASCEPCNLHIGDPRRHDPPAQPRRQW